MLDDAAFAQRVRSGIDALRLASRETPGLAWIVGTPLDRPADLPGKRFHNGMLVLSSGEVIATYAKQLLPTYNVFDERRHFEPGPDVARVVCVAGVHIGLLICEDGWNNEGADYAVNPFTRLADAQPDLIVSINALPSNVGKREQRHRIFSQACAQYGVPMLYVNQVGGHDQLVYDGASFAVDTTGEIAFEARRFETDVTTLAFDADSKSFLAADGSDLTKVAAVGMDVMEFYLQQIVLGLRDYARRCGFSSVVVGCSGGIDSALTIAIASMALGPKNVLAVTMPSVFSSEGSVSDSVLLCSGLGVPLVHHPIAGIVKAFELAHIDARAVIQGLALENLQARVRGTILMTYSNMEGHLLLTTGNKSEISVGYCTIYGDTNGGLGLIGDLYKTEVFALCRHINARAGQDLIPVGIIDKPPSAELAPGQRDSDSLPPYEVLDAILRLHIEPGHLASDESAAALETVRALRQAGNEALLARIARMVARNEYKRRQAPPIIRVRGRAFGAGRQMPIAAVHE